MPRSLAFVAIPLFGSIAACGASTVLADVQLPPDAGWTEPTYDAGLVQCERADAAGLMTASVTVSDAAPPVAPDAGILISDGRYVVTSLTGYGISRETLESIAVTSTQVLELRAGVFQQTFRDPYTQWASGTYATVGAETVFQQSCPRQQSYRLPAVPTPNGFDFIIVAANGPVVVESFTRF